MRRFEIEAKLVKGSGGIFDVELEGELLFSKHDLGRFPQPGEVGALIARHLQDKN